MNNPLCFILNIIIFKERNHADGLTYQSIMNETFVNLSMYM